MIYEFENENGETVEIKSEKQPTEKEIRKAFLNQSIAQEQKATLQQENPVISGLFPRGMQAQVDDAGIGQTLGASIGDTFSLAGRLVAASKDFSGDNIQEKIGNYLKSVGEVKGEGFLQEVLRHPATGAALTMAPMLPSLGLGVMGTAGVEGVGVAGVSQASRLGEGRDLSAGEAMIDIGSSLAMPGFGQVFKRYTPAMKASILKASEKVVNPALKNVMSSISGLSKDALEVASTKVGRERLLGLAGRTSEIGDNLLSALDNIDDNFRYEDKLKLALGDMPPISPDAVIKTLNSEIDKLGHLPNEAAAAARLRGYVDGLKKEFTTYETVKVPFKEASALLSSTVAPMQKTVLKDAKIATMKPISASDFRNLRKRLDVSIDHTQEGADLFNGAMKKARSEAKNSLIVASKGTPYEETMEQYSKALSARERLYAAGLGGNSFTRQQRVESWLSNLHGKNKTARQQLLKDVDEALGEGFSEQTKLVSLANEIVKDGSIPPFAIQPSGRSLLGSLGGAGTLGFGAATGNVPAMATGVASLMMQSPQIAPRMLNATRGLANVPDITSQIINNPYLQQTVPGLARVQMRGE
jgi:hypothetical protein